MHDQMVKCLRENGPTTSTDVSKSISDATQSAMVVRLENELAQQRAEQADRTQSLTRQIEDGERRASELNTKNEKLCLQIKDLEWQLQQLRDSTADKKRQMEADIKVALFSKSPGGLIEAFESYHCPSISVQKHCSKTRENLLCFPFWAVNPHHSREKKA